MHFQSAASPRIKVVASRHFASTIMTLTATRVSLSCTEGVTEIATDFPMSRSAWTHVVVREQRLLIFINLHFMPWVHRLLETLRTPNWWLNYYTRWNKEPCFCCWDIQWTLIMNVFVSYKYVYWHALFSAKNDRAIRLKLFTTCEGVRYKLNPRWGGGGGVWNNYKGSAMVLGRVKFNEKGPLYSRSFCSSFTNV